MSTPGAARRGLPLPVAGGARSCPSWSAAWTARTPSTEAGKPSPPPLSPPAASLRCRCDDGDSAFDGLAEEAREERILRAGQAQVDHLGALEQGKVERQSQRVAVALGRARARLI